MEILGKNYIGSELSNSGEKTFRAHDPRAGKEIPPSFYEATQDEVERALDLADLAAAELRTLGADRIVEFLAAIREEILALGDQLIERATQETALDADRLNSERQRTVNQISLFMEIVKEGSWVDARIDTSLPERKPLPRPDIRRILQPIGPVAVFGASNFPLAFSVAGGDTISAFAAGNSVVVKAHPAHPGTSELVASAIARAAKRTSMPEGVFSMVHGVGADVGLALAAHPKTRAVAFTGSQRAGRALFDAAARRPDPIPVFAEMGSTNPVFILSGVLENDRRKIAEGLSRSVLLGVGQFCTCPGLVFGVESDRFKEFREHLIGSFEQASPGTMLNASIRNAYTADFQKASQVKGVRPFEASRAADSERTEGRPGVLITDSDTWQGSDDLHKEIFGPATVVVLCQSDAQLLEAARSLEGSLTATIHGTPEDLASHRELIEILALKAGRLVFNGFPTGVEVGYAMHHGGPYPATTDEKFTSVGAAAIYRFARPVCYQNFPEHLLPLELQNANPRNIYRMINGELTREAIR